MGVLPGQTWWDKPRGQFAQCFSCRCMTMPKYEHAGGGGRIRLRPWCFPGFFLPTHGADQKRSRTSYLSHGWVYALVVRAHLPQEYGRHNQVWHPVIPEHIITLPKRTHAKHLHGECLCRDYVLAREILRRSLCHSPNISANIQISRKAWAINCVKVHRRNSTARIPLTVLGTGEECPPCDPMTDLRCEREGAGDVL